MFDRWSPHREDTARLMLTVQIRSRKNKREQVAKPIATSSAARRKASYTQTAAQKVGRNDPAPAEAAKYKKLRRGRIISSSALPPSSFERN